MAEPPSSLHKTMNAAAWPHEPELEKRLIALEKRGPAGLPPRDICRLIQFVKYAITAQCTKDNFLVKDGTVYRLQLPEKGFEREINAMVMLGRALNFSEPFHEWVDGRLKALAFRMAREHNSEKMKSVWAGMDENGRLGYLRAVQAIQAGTFSDDQVPIKGASVSLQKLSGNVLGAFLFGGEPLDKNAPLQIVVDPGALSLSTADSATSTTVHEGLHSLLRQLAVAQHSHAISSKHPFFKDFELIYNYVLHDCYMGSTFREAYNADLEERLSNKHYDYQRLYEQESARRKNLTERIGPRP